MTNLESAINQIRTARAYTRHTLGHINDDDWFRMPDASVTHVAWQVGHLAASQYRSALRGMRDETAADAELLPTQFREQFGRGSVPFPDESAYPSPDEIRLVLDRVYKQVLEEARAMPDETINDPAGPHPMFKTKLGALHWSVQHEFIHAGQIGLLRRLFGAEPLR